MLSAQTNNEELIMSYIELEAYALHESECDGVANEIWLYDSPFANALYVGAVINPQHKQSDIYTLNNGLLYINNELTGLSYQLKQTTRN
jgi:hypothetical protein